MRFVYTVAFFVIIGFLIYFVISPISEEQKNYDMDIQSIKNPSSNPPVIINSQYPKTVYEDWKVPGNICVSNETKCTRLCNYCLDAKNNILACDSVEKVVRVITTDDELLAVWKLDFGPEAIESRADGTTIVAGSGKAAILDHHGKVIRQAGIPGTAASGLGSSGDDIFIAVRKGTGFAVYRMDGNLENQTQIINGLRGCCGQMDITAKDGIVYVAANTLFKVLKYDRTGKQLGSFGKQGRTGVDTFKGCCEPKNVYFDSDGYLYTAESDDCCIKKFTPEGRFVEHVGNVMGIRGCVRVTIARSADKSKFYMLDTGRNIVRSISVSDTKTPRLANDKIVMDNR